MLRGWAILCALAPLAGAQSVSFSREVFPILQKNCLACHGAAQQMSGLDLRTRATALKGGVKGPAVVEGNAAESALIRRVTGAVQPAMPLGSKLDARDVDILRRWIDQGAAWDPNATPDWWAFRQPVRHQPPKTARHPIDAFLRQKMAEKSLTPAPPADRRAWIRRAYLDLTGLLPLWTDVEAFTRDSAPDAFEKVIDRLLASPHYGERWGRHWLDVARYADSGGYEQDFDYPNAWRYRDYVIRAFNANTPYDRFIREQIAGDEMEGGGYDALIATGFHRVGATVGFREKDNPQYRYTYLDDLIGTTSRAFLALTVSCARCHDHKFDPISQMDYYRMQAIFFPYIHYDHPLAPADEVAAHDGQRAAVEAKAAPLKRRVEEIEAPYR
ncbi:MAG: DUF1549 domain-containing protein, partial [Bryobacteraceae bacterium]